MSDAALLILSNEIDNSNLEQFVTSLGGKLVHQESNNYVVTINDGRVWLAIQPPEFREEFHEQCNLKSWECALNQPPKTIIELQIGHSDSSYELYLYIFMKAGEIWNAILDDIDEEIITLDNLYKKYPLPHRLP